MSQVPAVQRHVGLCRDPETTQAPELATELCLPNVANDLVMHVFLEPALTCVRKIDSCLKTQPLVAARAA